MYNFAETRTAQKEMFMVVPTVTLKISTVYFEKWIDKFTETIGMSAGTSCFTTYFGDQMLGSMLRIFMSRRVHGNYPSANNRDFSVLFSKLSAKYEVEKSARAITGMDYTVQNFISLFREQNQLAKKTQESMQREPARAHLARKATRARAHSARTRSHLLHQRGQQKCCS